MARSIPGTRSGVSLSVRCPAIFMYLNFSMGANAGSLVPLNAFYEGRAAFGASLSMEGLGAIRESLLGVLRMYFRPLKPILM